MVRCTSSRAKRAIVFFMSASEESENGGVSNTNSYGFTPRTFTWLLRLAGSPTLLAQLWPERAPGSAERAAAAFKHAAEDEEDEEVPYVAHGEPSSLSPAEADSHACEKVQGRLCSVAMLSCCCAGVACAVNGGPTATLIGSSAAFYLVPLAL